MKKFRCFMQIAYSPNNALITVSCRLRGGCERLPTTKVQHSRAAFLYHAVEHLRQPCLHIGQFFRGRSHGFREHPCQRLGACVTISNNEMTSRPKLRARQTNSERPVDLPPKPRPSPTAKTGEAGTSCPLLFAI